MEMTEERKRMIYRDVTATHHFVHIAVETLGAFGLEAPELVRETGKWLLSVAHEAKSGAFIF